MIVGELAISVVGLRHYLDAPYTATLDHVPSRGASLSQPDLPTGTNIGLLGTLYSQEHCNRLSLRDDNPGQSGNGLLACPGQHRLLSGPFDRGDAFLCPSGVEAAVLQGFFQERCSPLGPRRDRGRTLRGPELHRFPAVCQLDTGGQDQCDAARIITEGQQEFGQRVLSLLTVKFDRHPLDGWRQARCIADVRR